jgi:hypothetical protein
MMGLLISTSVSNANVVHEARSQVALVRSPRAHADTLLATEGSLSSPPGIGVAQSPGTKRYKRYEQLIT